MKTKQMEIYEKLPPNKRLEIGCSLHDFAFNRVVDFFKSQNINKSDDEIQILATKRFLGESARFL